MSLKGTGLQQYSTAYTFGVLRNLKVLLTPIITAMIMTANAQPGFSQLTATSAGTARVNGIDMYYEVHDAKISDHSSTAIPQGADADRQRATALPPGTSAIPLVLIHGGGSTIESTFGNMIPLLITNHKVIAVELQAHGRTSDRDAPESFEQDADDVAGLLKFLKVEKANVLGFSNGGTTTLQLAIRHPEIINKIIAISATYERAGMIKGFFDGMKGATPDDMPPPLITAFLKVNSDKDKLAIMFDKDKQRMLNFTDISNDKIASIKSPALIISGDDDVVLPEHALKLSRTIPDAKLLIVPGTHGSFIGEVCTANKGSRSVEATTIFVTQFLNEAVATPK
jgi:pimeloyl-ACP methyl ester carboxylesterase